MHIKILLRSPFVLFAFVLAASLLTVNFVFRASQFDKAAGALQLQFDPIHRDSITREPVIDDRAKLLMSEEGDLSKWLLGLASGALVTVLGAHIKLREQEAPDRHAYMLAYAFLLTSMYGAFLSYQAKLQFLRRPENLPRLYGPEFDVPTLVQLWFLLAGLVALAIGTFRRVRPTLVPIFFVLLSALQGTSRASGQPVRQSVSQPVSVAQCSAAWVQDRYGSTARLDAPAVAAFFTRILQQQPGMALRGCNDVELVLDEVRFQTLLKPDRPDDMTHLQAALNAITGDLSRPAGSRDQIVTTLVAWLSPWDAGQAGQTSQARLGTLVIEGTKVPCDVRVDGQNVGKTGGRWYLRLPAKADYHVRVLDPDSGKVVYASDTVAIRAGDETTLHVSSMVTR